MNKSKETFELNRKHVVVVGRNYGNILAMTRDLGRAGYEVQVLRVFKKKPRFLNPLARLKPDAYSRYVTVFRQCIVSNDKRKLIDVLIDMGQSNDKVLLMPVDDYSVQVIDEYLDELVSMYYIPSVNAEAGAIGRLMDKHYQKTLAREYGLPLLQGSIVRSENGQFTIPKDIVYPCFVKPNVSMNSTKSKMVRCEDETSLFSVLTRYAADEDFEMLVEAFADIKQEYSILGLCTNEGVMAPGVFKALAGGHKERKGVAVMGEMIDGSPLQGIIEQCNGFIQSLGYSGLFDVDLIETKDGKIYFVELNFRAGASAHALTEMGVNLPGMYADYFMKEDSIDYDCGLEEYDKVFLSEKVLLEEFVRSDVSFRELREYTKKADIFFIRDVEDCKPFEHFQRGCLVAVLLRLPYRIRDWKSKF